LALYHNKNKKKTPKKRKGRQIACLFVFFNRSALAEALALGDLVGVDVDLVTVTVAFVAAAFVEITILTVSAYTVITHDSFLLKIYG
jgi:hypothetical protein